MFARAARKQCLADRVVDLMRAGVQEVFALQINLRATGMCSQPLRVEQWSGSSGVVAQQQVEFAPKIRVASSQHELSGQLLKRRDQCFRNVAATEFTPMAVFVGLTFCNSRFSHRDFRLLLVEAGATDTHTRGFCRLSPCRRGEE